MFAQNHALIAATEAQTLKARAQKGDLTACFDAHKKLLDYWAQGYQDHGTALAYFDAALSGKTPDQIANFFNYKAFKERTVLPLLLATAEDAFNNWIALRAPYELNKNVASLSGTFDALTRHQISAFYDLYLAHASQPSPLVRQHADAIKATPQTNPKDLIDAIAQIQNRMINAIDKRLGRPQDTLTQPEKSNGLALEPPIVDLGEELILERVRRTQARYPKPNTNNTETERHSVTAPKRIKAGYAR